ncbi:MAG: hypothetical protein RR623_00015 [Bacilli bacterium]
MADLRIVDAPEIPTENITGEEKLPTGGSGNYSISLDSLADYTKTKKDLADNAIVDNKVGGVRKELEDHIEDLLNPHQVTKGQIGLGNVDNTADADKPVSNSTQAAIISAVAPKADKTYLDNQLTLKANKSDVYTKSETYTKQESSDLVNNSISSALTPVNTSLDLAKRGVVNRYDPSLTYNSGERVVLSNGDIVKSTVDGNTNDPNVDMTGWEFNDNTVESIADLLAIQNPKDGQTVFVKNRQGGTFVYRASKALVNDGVVTFFGWTRASFMFLTLRMGGAIGDGITGEWENINKVLRYGFENNLTVDGEGLTYITAALYIDSNLYLKNANFKNSVLHQNMISVFTTDENPDTWLENVTFENVHIDGNRSECTGLPSGAFDEDGGRHGFRFVKKCRNIRFIDSGADNCCVDGAIFYAKGALQGAWSHFIKGVTFEGKCHFNNNGRWGISGDSVDGMTFGDGMKASGNGLSLGHGADITTGLSARLHEGKEYGGAVDIEEYRGDAYSKNIIFGAVDFTKNAAGSVCFTRTGAIAYPTYNVYFRSGGLFDNGISLNKSGNFNFSLNFSGYSTTLTENSYRSIFIDDVDLGGGDVLFTGTNDSSVSNIHNLVNVFLTLSDVSFDKKYPFVLNDPFSNYKHIGTYSDKNATWVGKDGQQSTLNIHNASSVGSKSRIHIRDNGATASGFEFEKSDGGYDLHFLNGENPILTFRKYGSIVPAVDNIAQVGESSHRISKFYGHAMSVSSLGVFSDNNAAKTGGLVAGDFYRTSTGNVMVVF